MQQPKPLYKQNKFQEYRRFQAELGLAREGLFFTLLLILIAILQVCLLVILF